MALLLYKTTDPSSQVTSDGKQTNPIFISVEGKFGDVDVGVVYLRNDDPNVYYTNISIQVPNAANNGISVKLYHSTSSSSQPIEAVWSTITANTPLALGSSFQIGPSTSTYVPIWYRFEVPANFPHSVIANMPFQVTATENAVV